MFIYSPEFNIILLHYQLFIYLFSKFLLLLESNVDYNVTLGLRNELLLDKDILLIYSRNECNWSVVTELVSKSKTFFI